VRIVPYGLALQCIALHLYLLEQDFNPNARASCPKERSGILVWNQQDLEHGEILHFLFLQKRRWSDLP
jgi:hypothetical protein